MKEKSELDILIPEETIIIGSETVKVSPFLFTDFKRIRQIGVNIMNDVYQQLLSRESAEEALITDKDGNVTMKHMFDGEIIKVTIANSLYSKIDRILDAHENEVIEMISLATGRPKEFFLSRENGVTINDIVTLLCMILEQNYDFFTKRFATTKNLLAAKRA